MNGPQNVQNNTEFNYAQSELESLDNDVGVVDIAPTKRKYAGLGIIVMLEPSKYSDSKEVNTTTHLPANKEEICQAIQNQIVIRFLLPLKNIIIGHEHGTKDGKCHYQVCLLLMHPVQTLIRPGKFQCNGSTYLYITQRARHSKALSNYCKKDGDFFVLNPDQELCPVYKKDGKGKDTTQIDVYKTIVKNKEILSSVEVNELLFQHDTKSAMVSHKNIQAFIDSNFKPQLPEFKWNFPKYLSDNPLYLPVFNWYKKWCLPEDLSRRKALLLYSEKRAMGKTEFAKSLVNHEGYYVAFRNTFTSEALKEKDPHLLILDDMACYTPQNKETWKALVASEPTSIRDAYLNMDWNHRIPCIITTNNLSLVTNIVMSPDFTTQVTVFCVDHYMGPEGTQPAEFTIQEHTLSENVLNSIKKKTAERESYVFSHGGDKHQLTKALGNSQNQIFGIQMDYMKNSSMHQNLWHEARKNEQRTHRLEEMVAKRDRKIKILSTQVRGYEDASEFVPLADLSEEGNLSN